MSAQTKQPLIEKEDVDKNSKEEGNYFDWHAKQLDYMKLPVFCPPPRSAQRGFSTDKSRKTKASTSSQRSEIDDSMDAQSEQSNQMN